MALINCPECGKEISEKATNCPNCGCPILKNEPTGEKTVEKIYYENTINGTYFKLTSSLWQFGGLNIPVKSVSAIYLSRSTSYKSLLLAAILVFVSITIIVGFIHLRMALWANWDNILMALIFLLIAYLLIRFCRRYGIEVVSHSGTNTTVVKSYTYLEELNVLEKTAILCLKENA